MKREESKFQEKIKRGKRMKIDRIRGNLIIRGREMRKSMNGKKGRNLKKKKIKRRKKRRKRCRMVNIKL